MQCSAVQGSTTHCEATRRPGLFTPEGSGSQVTTIKRCTDNETQVTTINQKNLKEDVKHGKTPGRETIKIKEGTYKQQMMTATLNLAAHANV